jgi:hypothetical protein
MSITWTISHPLRLVVATGKGETTSADFLFYLDEIVKAGAIPYRRLLDLTGVGIPMPLADILLVGRHFANLADKKLLGPSAIVVTSNAFANLVKIFDAAVEAERPLKIFRDLRAARAWLDEIAPVTAPGGTPG